MQIYNIPSSENNEYKIGDPPCKGLAPARTLITSFVPSLFSGLDMLYVYIICIYIHTTPILACVEYVFQYETKQLQNVFFHC